VEARRWTVQNVSAWVGNVKLRGCAGLSDNVSLYDHTG